MSLKKLFATVAVAVVMSVNAAQAAFTDLGTVAAGDTGVVVDSGIGAFLNVISGKLPAGLKINFEYNLNGVLGANLSETAYYDFSKDGHHYAGFTYTNANGSQLVHSTVDGSPSPSLALTTADLTTTPATTSVSNFSGGTISFVNILFGILSRGANVIVHYTVSSVPLPAMAPLFGAALAGLGFVARRKAAKA